jgi:hypothetical protein
MTKVIKLKLVQAPNPYLDCEGCYTIKIVASCQEIINIAKEQGIKSCLTKYYPTEHIYVEDFKGEHCDEGY